MGKRAAAVGARLVGNDNLADLADADAALDNLGLTETGKAVVTAADAEAARDVLGKY